MMNPSPTPSRTTGQPDVPVASCITRVYKLTILRFENEDSLSKVFVNPQRLPLDAQDGARTHREAMVRALAAEQPKDLARAKAILLAHMDSASISVSWVTASARRDTPGLPIRDLRGNHDATEAAFSCNAALCPALTEAITDSSVVAVFVDHPAFNNGEAWIALLKPNAIETLNAKMGLRLTLGRTAFPYEVLFGPRDARDRLRRLGGHLTSVGSAVAKFLAALGALVLLARKIGIV